MGDDPEAPPPKAVAYDPTTGVPAEFNEFLPKDSEEYKKWKAFQDGPEAIEKLTLKDKQGNEIEKQLPGGKVKKKQKAMVMIETSTRSKKKSITSVSGLSDFGIKLADASKIFGKKFAAGSSVTKTASGTEQIEIQGDFMADLPDLIMKNYAKNLTKANIFYMGEDKKKHMFYDSESDEDED
eukprot:gene14733-20778_t